MKKNIFSNIRITLILLAITAIAAVVIVALIKCDDTTLAKTHNDKIEISPALIQSIEAIGQWEFLTVNSEEYVDTIRHRLLGDDGLARIYYGTLRFGIDLSQANSYRLELENDTILVATLPTVALLDSNFIDEARTRTFYEEGNWNAQTREALYQRAHYQMLKRNYTKANLQKAEENAERQFKQLFSSVGYKDVRIQFQKSAN